MKKVMWVCVWVGLLSLTTVGAFADIVVAPADASAGFSTWTGAALNNNGTPFWDNPSTDALPP